VKKYMDWVRLVLYAVGLIGAVAVLYSRLVLVEFRLTSLEGKVDRLVEQKIAKE